MSIALVKHAYACYNNDMKTQSDKQINRIASFSVDHDKIGVGIYVSRVDGDVTTYDLRTRVPNAGDYLSDVAMHSVEQDRKSVV